ncbi:MAG TPA: IS1182 family transposase [Bacteroidales bacterium]|nr:IS1182 family transposase [Bacteroidales bacterium]
MAYRCGTDRHQTTFLPPSLDQYIGQDHPVRAYDVFVDTLNFKELGIKLDDHKVGNSEYDPRCMLKLLVYGYSYGVFSSRKLEREVHNNLSFIWLMKQLKPDHKTIAEFRRKNKAALEKTLGLCARMCLKLELMDANIFFVDGSKVRANAGRSNLHDKQWYEDKLKEIDKKIPQILNQCEQIDQGESQCGSQVAMPKELAKAQKLKEAVKEALDEFTKRGEKTKDGNKRKVNLVDPDSVLVQSRQGTHCGYSVQTVVDDKNGLIAHVDVVSEANDANQLADQIFGADAELGCECEIACADAGYSDIIEIAKLESAEKTVIVPSQAQAGGKEAGAFDKSKFTYDSESDCYLCPEGHRLTFRRFQDKDKQKKDYRIENSKQCRSCRHFGQCTQSKQGRTITRHVLEELRETVSKRFEDPAIRKIYDRRKCRAEHPFGYIKKVLRFGQFLLRGLDGVRAEASMLGTGFNLKRMINLLGGVQGFIARIQSVQASI